MEILYSTKFERYFVKVRTGLLRKFSGGVEKTRYYV
jgi:hypothetical protein